jgi:hypothetical protein
MHFKIFGLHIVIICNYETASSLMSQASYSDRPILTMVGKLWVFILFFRLIASRSSHAHSGDSWRRSLAV